MASRSIRPKRPAKPSKPRSSFPLPPHHNGWWCKKSRGKVHVFGVWEDPQAALERYVRKAAHLHAGRRPKQRMIAADRPRVKEVCNRSSVTYCV